MDTDLAMRCVYSRDFLYDLRKKPSNIVFLRLPMEIRKLYQGCRASAKLKAKRLSKKWRFKPLVSSMIMENDNSLPNKIDELAMLTKNLRTLRECSLLCFTETRLTASILDANVELLHFNIVRADRDTKTCGKPKGGELVLYMNKRWCNPGNVNIKITISCNPYYLPREFSHAIFIVIAVYIPLRANAETACDLILRAVAKLQTRHPKAIVLISRDFNHVTLDKMLAAFHQCVGQRDEDYKPKTLRMHMEPCPCLHWGKQTTTWFCSNLTTNNE